jgi:hypothetical protein
MKRTTTRLGALAAVAALLVLPPPGQTQQPPSPLERYRGLEYPPKPENFDKGWKERVTAEFAVVNAAGLGDLKAALKDRDPFVRAVAARALGVRADKGSVDALAGLAEGDPEPLVRVRAVEALGLLKAKPEAVERAKKDRNGGVRWVATLAAGQLKGDTDYAALVRQAYSEGIKREALGSAQVGRPAPDFAARTSDGKPFKLSAVLGKKPVAIYFAAYDG